MKEAQQCKHGARRTKIIATLGPASRSTEAIRELIEAGVNVFRLNFSHGTYEEHKQALDNIREVAAKEERIVAVLQDLSGPKIRISEVKGDFLTIEGGSKIELLQGPVESFSDDKRIYVPMLDPAKVLEEGHSVLLADGIIKLQAEEVKDDKVICSVVQTGRMRSRVGIAFPDSDINLPATTEKDIEDMKWGVKNGVDYVAISFVESAADVVMLRELISEEKGHAKIIAKIERKCALETIDDIINVTDGLMVARGDLGVDIPFEKLPVIQKELINKSNYNGIPVIVATQMLHSMITAIRPTRAEVSDIAAAVMTGTDAVMLSEETAIGEHPALAVKCLSKIACEAEKSLVLEEGQLAYRETDTRSVPDAVAFAATAAALKIDAKALIAPTASGATAGLMAKYRPHSPLFGVSDNDIALRRMCLFWGVIPVSTVGLKDSANELDLAAKAVQLYGDFPNGTRAVITGGLSGQKAGTTSVLQIKSMEGL